MGRPKVTDKKTAVWPIIHWKNPKSQSISARPLDVSRRGEFSIIRAKIDSMSFNPASSLIPAWWLVRIPEVFSKFADQLCPGAVAKRGESSYHRVASNDPDWPLPEACRMFSRWNLPVHHAWPCEPENVACFVEKAAQAIVAKFSGCHPRALLIGAFEPHSRKGYFRKLASNLRGRTLQLMPAADGTADTIAAQDPVVYVLLGRTGMFCGLHAPLRANGFHPGGTRYIRQSGEGVPSRAGAKVAEALHHMALFAEVPAAPVHWLELGACPGGMTAELLRRGYRVTAIDRAPLDRTLDGARGLDFIRADVAMWKPPADAVYGAMLCDMNGPAEMAFSQVSRLALRLRPGSPVVFTLKTTGADDVASIRSLESRIRSAAASAGLIHLQTTHLSYNRNEFTMFLKRVFIGNPNPST